MFSARKFSFSLNPCFRSRAQKCFIDRIRSIDFLARFGSVFGDGNCVPYSVISGLVENGIIPKEIDQSLIRDNIAIDISIDESLNLLPPLFKIQGDFPDSEAKDINSVEDYINFTRQKGKYLNIGHMPYIANKYVKLKFFLQFHTTFVR